MHAQGTLRVIVLVTRGVIQAGTGDSHSVLMPSH
jgi:hypothetical protein